MTHKPAKLAATSAAVMLAVSPAVFGDDEPLVIGTMATLEGAFASAGEDGMRGFEMALAEYDYEIGGREIEVITESTDTTPESAVNAAQKLVSVDDADILLGPLSGSEGIAVRDYSRNVDGVTFINGASAAQETTLRNPSENFFRFSTDGAQWMAGLGTYVVEERGWDNVATVAEDYSYPYSQVAGFLYEYCDAGGDVAERFWMPIGTSDYSSIVYSIPPDVDAVFVALTGADAVDFLQQYRDAGGEAPIIGGTNTVDGTVLSAEGGQRDHLVGTPSAAPIPGDWDDADWTAWVDRYHEMFGDDALDEPSVFAHAYYTNARAMMAALDEIDGDIDDDHANFQQALADLEVDTPTGPVGLDENRAAIANMFLREVRQDDDGNLYNANIGVTENVSQTLGLPRDEFLALEEPSRNHPQCSEIR